MLIERALIIDDDRTVRRLAEIALGRFTKWNLMFADSASMALQLIPEFQPDVILLDVMMPEMDGMTLFKLLSRELAQPQAPVIFLTARARTDEVQTYRELGAAGVITKPFDPLTLGAEIQNIIDKANAPGRIA